MHNLTLFLFLTVTSTSLFTQELTEDQKAYKVFEEYYQLQIQRSPMNAAYAEEKVNMDKLDDISFQYQKESVRLFKGIARKLKRKIDYKKLTRRTQVYYQIMLESIKKAKADYKWRFHKFTINHMRGYHTWLHDFLNYYHPIENYQDAENYVKRLKDIPRLFKQVKKIAEAQARKGIILPKHSLEKIRSTLQGMISAEKSKRPLEVFYQGLENKIKAIKNLRSEQKEAFKVKAEEAISSFVLPAYSELLDSIDILIVQASSQIGSWQFPRGRKYYKYKLRDNNTTAMTAPQVHQLGLSEVTRIHKEIKGIMKTVNFEGTLQEFFEFTKTDEQFFYKNTDEGRNAYLKDAKAIIDKMKSKLPVLFNDLPKIDVVVQRVPIAIQETGGLAYYSAPSDDGKRPGRYFVNLRDMSELPKYEMEALAYHEGVPGHHLQFLYNIKTRKLNPKFVRNIWYTAHIEGWGLYAEYLPKEYGAYQDPYSDYGRLTMELWRASRLVLDTGIHHYGWSREKAVQYLLDHTPSSESANVTAVDRYTTWPGQATAYLIGKNKILELKKKAEEELGGLFDIREFHQTVLQYGSLPLSLLEELIDEYIQNKLSEESVTIPVEP